MPRPPHSHAAHPPCRLPEPVTCLVLQKVILLHELPVGLQSLGSAGQVEGIGVSVQQVLERLQGGLAGLEGEEPVLSIWVFSFSSLPSHPHPVPTRSWKKSEPVLALPEDPIHSGPCKCTSTRRACF